MVRPNEGEQPPATVPASDYVPQWWPGTSATGQGFSYTSSGMAAAATALHQRADALQDAIAGLQAAVAALPCGPGTWHAAAALRDTCTDVARIITVHTRALASNLRYGGDSISDSHATYQHTETVSEDAASALGGQLTGQLAGPVLPSASVAPPAGSPTIPRATPQGGDLL